MTSGTTTVIIKLGDEEKVLTPTFAIARTISTRYGGVAPAIERVLKMDIEVVADIVALGCGYNQSKRPPEDFLEKVWRTGLTDDTGGLAERAVTFLRMIAGGGRLPDEDTLPEEEAAEKPEDPQ